jgi:ketosteroid isomerase-like protein
MKRLTRSWLVAIWALVIAGCSTSSDPASPLAAGTQDVAASSERQPTDTVARFYEALRKGDEPAIADLLTDKAKAETAKSGLGIQSQGSNRLEYELGEVEYVNEALDGAHVQSLWIDYDERGERLATEVIWVLRKQSDGWRVAGMATQIAEGQLPLLFNFEDPEDMLRKKEYVERQYAEAEQAYLQQASRTADPAGGGSLVR